VAQSLLVKRVEGIIMIVAVVVLVLISPALCEGEEMRRRECEKS